jgi:hypothetical protein
MSFREKSAGITLLCLVAVYGGYAVWALSGARSIPDSEAALILAVVLMVASMIVIHILAAILSGREARAAKDERDRTIGWRSARNAYYTLMTFIWVSPAINLLQPGTVGLVNAVVATIVLAEIVNYASRLVYYRRGV